MSPGVSASSEEYAELQRRKAIRAKEQAVIDAARAWVECENEHGLDGAHYDEVCEAIHDAVRALDGEAGQ